MNTSTAEMKKSKEMNGTIINILIAICFAGLIVWGGSTYFNLGKNLYTNDAQIEEYINPINSRISGYIAEVRFNEHQQVKKGDTLLLLDNSEYRIQLEQAEASYMSAIASKEVTSFSVSTIGSNLSVSDANIEAMRARLWNAKQNYLRYANLLKEGAATEQQFEQIKTDYDALLSQTNAVVQQRHTTRLSTDETSKKIAVNDAEIKRTHALVEMAKLNLSYTVIVAPYDGVTGRRSVQEGQLLQAGQTLLSFVRNGNKWVVANFKENQIARLLIGQRVSLKIDGLDDKEFTGKVTAISQATGSRYSAVPTDNSTGNFVKVQQRIPVKIEFLETKNAKVFEQLRAGMNVQVQSVH